MSSDTVIAAEGAVPAAVRRPLWPRIRRAIFWTHLAAGCSAGVVIFMMSVTGVLLTYERQIMASLEAASWAEHPADAERMTVEALLESVRGEDFRPAQVVVRSDPAAPVQISAGRRNRVELDAVTGAEVPPGAPAVDEFFTTLMRIHRWFALEGDARDTGKAITGAANLAFLFILLSGLVIWLPPVWKRAFLLAQIRFSRRYPTAKARDYNWHHVIGIWSLVPLVFIVASATVFNYGWASEVLYGIAGAKPRAEAETDAPAATPLAGALDTDALLTAASAAAGDWERLTLTLPETGAESVELIVDRGNGAQVQHQTVMTVDRRSGAVLSEVQRYGDDPGRYARFVNRFLHTGEIYGIPGQTIAGLVSLGGALLVWTGLALAWRRLIAQPMRRRAAAARRVAG